MIRSYREMVMITAKYQEAAKAWAQRSTSVVERVARMSYVVMGLVGEAGELANLTKKYIRGDFHRMYADLDEADREARAWALFVSNMTDELGDVLWYVFSLCEELGVSIEAIMVQNHDKLMSRLASNDIVSKGGNHADYA